MDRRAFVGSTFRRVLFVCSCGRTSYQAVVAE